SSRDADLLRRLADESPIWDHLGPTRIVVTAYLTYAGGARGQLFRFLFQNQYRLALGITGPEGNLFWKRIKARLRDQEFSPQGPRAALLIGKREHHFTLREIRYLQEASRLAGLLIHNYNLVMREVESRRNKHELQLA